MKKKKVLIPILAVILLIILPLVMVNTERFAESQIEPISNWINNKGKEKPEVGPQAMEHLNWLKDEAKETYTCKIVDPNMDFVYEDVVTIAITGDESGEEVMRLNYSRDWRGKNFFIPFYFHHQSNFKHDHIIEKK